MKKKGSFGFKESIKKMRALERSLPVQVGNQAVVVFQTNFIAGGFIDKTRQKWKPKEDGEDSHLRKTGKLRRDIKLQPGANLNRILISTSLDYAAIHNFGGTIKKKEREGKISYRKGRGGKLKMTKTRTDNQRSKIVAESMHKIGAHTIKMPQRKFMGKSDYLNKQILFLIKQEITKIFKR